MALKTMDIEKHYGKEVAELFRHLEKVHDEYSLDALMGEFVEDASTMKGTVSIIGSSTVALARKHKESEGEKTTFGMAVCELTRNLSLSNEKIRDGIDSETRKAHVVDRPKIEMNVSEFFEKEVMSRDPTRMGEAMLKIGHGGFSSYDTMLIMDKLLREYQSSSGNRAVELEERVRTVNTTLAEENLDLRYIVQCEKSKAQFKDLKAA